MMKNFWTWLILNSLFIFGSILFLYSLFLFVILYSFFGCSKSYSTQLEEGFTTKWIEEREGFKNKEDLKRIHWEISDVFEAQLESYVYDVKTENDSIYFRQKEFAIKKVDGFFFGGTDDQKMPSYYQEYELELECGGEFLNKNGISIKLASLLYLEDHYHLKY